ncbi:hypothetical protein Fmac_021067 [Flemingia macrophylla]|uniref:Uncharacterized protein n=1 Tax=Flemingia macrophylla TaxID=520843 RepID=A0ABD1LVV3_9FABA
MAKFLLTMLFSHLIYFFYFRFFSLFLFPPSSYLFFLVTTTPSATAIASIPDVTCSSIRPDIVNFVHSNISRNSRQPYVVTAALVTKPLPSPGESAAPSPVSPASLAMAPTAPARERSSTCVAVAACLPLPRSGDLADQKHYAMVSTIAASTIPSLALPATTLWSPSRSSLSLSATSSIALRKPKKPSMF